VIASILFWKSLPVSDLTTVLSKFTIPLIVLPFAQLCHRRCHAVRYVVAEQRSPAGSGLSVGTLGARMSFFHMSVMLLYHILTVHGLWYAPIYGWLLLVSAWAPTRAVYMGVLASVRDLGSREDCVQKLRISSACCSTA